MTNGLYAPPKSKVEDVTPDRALAEKPKQIVYAVALLWLSIPLGIPASIYEYQQSTADGLGSLTLPIFFLVYALAVLLNIFINRGANWARMLFAVVSMLIVVSFAVLFEEYSKYPPAPLFSDIVVLIIDLIVLYLLFTRPGALWFRRGY